MYLSKPIFKRILLALIAVVTGSWLLMSCITYKDINYLQQPNPDVARYKDSVRFEDYKLQPGDRLSIVVHSLNEETNKLFQGSENMDGASGGGSASDLFTYRVDEGGDLLFPYVGKVKAMDKTLREGGNGRYPLIKEKLNIFEALAISGDLSSLANRKQIKILRQTQSGTVVKTFDIRSKDVMHTDFYYIQPNDVIYVQKLPSHFFGVTSWSSLLGTVSTTISLLLLGISISKYF
jgi:polysaccharide export outer membrane protein